MACDRLDCSLVCVGDVMRCCCACCSSSCTSSVVLTLISLKPLIWMRSPWSRSCNLGFKGDWFTVNEVSPLWSRRSRISSAYISKQLMLTYIASVVVFVCSLVQKISRTTWCITPSFIFIVYVLPVPVIPYANMVMFTFSLLRSFNMLDVLTDVPKQWL